MAIERLYIENTYIPLSMGLNPSITKEITDISEPQKRKSAYSKTVSIPRSKEADKIFSHYFELNTINRTFDVNAKANVRYEVDSEVILRGYLKLNEVNINDFQDIVYDCTMYSEVADFWANIRNEYMIALYASVGSYEGLDKFDHTFTKEIQQFSWDNQIWYNGGFIPFDFGTGYVYPLIDYGLSSNSIDFTFTQIGCAIYVREYIRKIIAKAGFTYTSAFIDGTIFEHLIIPSSPAIYQLTTAEIQDREFAANTPLLTSTGTTTSNNLSYNSYSTKDLIRCSVEVVDAGLNYNPATGIFTVVNSGTYDLNALMDIQATFTPNTGNNVKTRCEVDGFLEMWHTPLSTATEVLIAQNPFYITSKDAAFVAGARTTSGSPTYPDTDYLDSKHYSVYPNDTSLTGRSVSPPDRYPLTVNAMPLLAGDLIKIYWKAGLWKKETAGTFSTNFFVDNVGTYYDGDATITVAVGSFYNKVSNTVMQEGNTLTMDKVIPDKVKQLDFFMSICKRFNLWVDIDPNNSHNLIIEPRDTYLGSTVMNIHEMIDRSKEVTQIPMGTLDAKQYVFKDQPDNDYWNAKYFNDWQRLYGERLIEVESEFLSNIQVIDTIFSPTTMVAQPNSDLVLPTIEQYDQSGAPISTKHNIRMLYYAGMKPTTFAWNHINYILSWPYLPLVDTFVEYPYAGHWDDPYNPTLDINFGLPKEVYYDDNLHDIDYTDNNCVNAYYGKQLRETTDEDSRILKAYVHLRPLDYINFQFNKRYYFDYTYFRLQNIEGYNPTSEETTLCTFLKINSASDFTATTGQVYGTPDVIATDMTGGNVNTNETAPVKPGFSYPDGNNSTTKTHTVQGENNLIGARAQYVEIYGDANRVFAETKNIKINGSNNIITAGVENVALINTNSVTVTESNVTYIDGKIIGNWVEKTGSFLVDDTVYGYYLNGTSGICQARLNNSTSEFLFKCTNGTYRVYIDAGAKTIDNTASTFDMTANESIRIKYNSDDDTYYIIN